MAIMPIKPQGLHLLNRVGEVGDIAQMAFLLPKSSFITGAIINVDGGTACRPQPLIEMKTLLLIAFMLLHFAGHKSTKH